MKVLDFNKQNLVFKEENLDDYNFNVVNQNIEKYRQFTYELSINKDFDEIFESLVFQITFNDNNSNYVANLVVVYNAIASTGLVNKKQYPQIDEESFIAQMELRGFECYKTRLTVSKNNYRYAKRFRKRNSFMWE